MKKVILFLCSAILCANHAFASDTEGKKVIVLGEGVTGTWAAAKISENLNKGDELIIISPPKNEVSKELKNGVFSNYTTSAFIPIGIQIEMGAINIEPPTHEDVENAKKQENFSAKSKLYISPDLDQETKKKLEIHVNSAQNSKINKSRIMLHYHRDVCFEGWKNYIAQGGIGIDFPGTIVLSENAEILEKLREKILKNREISGFPLNDESLKIIHYSKLTEIVPFYSALIENNKLSGLVGLTDDGRVKGSDVFKTLNNKIHSSKAKVKKIHGWVDGLQWHYDNLGNVVVTGVKLRNGKIIKADVTVSALGQGAEKILKSAGINLPILKKWGIVYSLPQDKSKAAHVSPVIIMRGLGIVRDVPGMPTTFGVGEWILPENAHPDPKKVLEFVKQSARIWGFKNVAQKWIAKHPVYVQPRPMTLDGLPVLDSHTKGLIIINPSGSQGNTQAPGSAYFAASKVLEQLDREVPDNLHLTDTVDWKYFEIYPDRFK